MPKLTTLKPRLKAKTLSRLSPSAGSGHQARVEARGTTAERGYGGWWQRESVAFREQYPGCAYCWLEGKSGPAELVDHLYPHGVRRGCNTPDQQRLFRDKTYWVSSCHEHHRGFKADIEAKGIEAIDELARRLGVEPLSDQALRCIVMQTLELPGRGGYSPPLRYAVHPKGIGLKPATCDLAVLFGPPAAGKSTAALAWTRGDKSRVIDLDWIQSELTGKPIRQSGDAKYAEAMRERNRRLKELSSQSGQWAFVIGAPRALDRVAWIEALQPRHALLLLPKEEILIERIKTDRTRAPVISQQLSILHKWLARYEPGEPQSQPTTPKGWGGRSILPEPADP